MDASTRFLVSSRPPSSPAGHVGRYVVSLGIQYLSCRRRLRVSGWRSVIHRNIRRNRVLLATDYKRGASADQHSHGAVRLSQRSEVGNWERLSRVFSRFASAPGSGVVFVSFDWLYC